MRPPKKTRNHHLVVRECDNARRALLAVKKLVEERYDHNTGEPLSPEDLRLKAGVAARWLQDAETAVAHVRTNLMAEIEHRSHESDPEVIRVRMLEAHLKQLKKQPKRRRSIEDLRPEVLRLREEMRMVPAAIADALGCSDSVVKKILRDHERTMA